MHFEILTDKQRELLPFIAKFKRSFYLVGGTAIALHIGHRYSIDFDLFTPKKINKKRIKEIVYKLPYSIKPLFEDIDQYHYYINDIKTTFFQYIYPVEHKQMVKDVISMPSLISLAAMKAYALGRRAKWKDYVDLYFILKDYYTVKEICNETDKIFGQLFSEKLFRLQLAFHKDIDYSEQVEYLPGFETNEQVIKDFLIETSLR